MGKIPQLGGKPPPVTCPADPSAYHSVQRRKTAQRTTGRTPAPPGKDARMARYFLEFISGTCILHQEGCFTYARTREELAWDRKECRGEFSEYQQALALGATRYRACSPCWCCLPQATAPKPRPLQRSR